LLQQAYNSATAGRIQGLLNIQKNSEGKGPYDFGYTDALGAILLSFNWSGKHQAGQQAWPSDAELRRAPFNE
jgi:hypothetical protein